MTDELVAIIGGTVSAARTQIRAGAKPDAARILLVTPQGLLARECYLDLTCPAQREPALAELRVLARQTKAHVAVMIVPLLTSVLFYVEVKGWSVWQGLAPIQDGTLLEPTFYDGAGSDFYPVLTFNSGSPIVDTDAG